MHVKINKSIVDPNNISFHIELNSINKVQTFIGKDEYISCISLMSEHLIELSKLTGNIKHVLSDLSDLSILNAIENNKIIIL